MNPVQTSLVSPPKLEGYDRHVVRVFLSEWDTYKDTIKRFNQAVADDRQLTATPLRDAIVPWILNHICSYILKLPSGSNKTVEDDTISQHLKEYTGVAVRNAYGSKDLFKPLKFVHYDDPLLSIMDLFRQCEQILDKHGLTEHFKKHEELQRKQIQGMTDALHPVSLRDTVRASLDVEEIECQSDLLKFHDFLLDTLKAFKRFNRDSSNPAGKAAVPSSRTFECFKCKGSHHVMQCPDCTPDEARRLLEEFRQAKRAESVNPSPSPNSAGSTTSQQSRSASRPATTGSSNTFYKPTFTRPPIPSRNPATRTAADGAASSTATVPPTSSQSPPAAASTSSGPFPRSQSQSVGCR
jgi:hypothetical protein